MTSRDHDAAGHHRSAGHAITGMGLLSTLLLAAVLVSDAELGFIDAWGVLGIAVVYLSVGLYMSSTEHDA